MTEVMFFAKAPRAGSVKTRLAAEIGAAAALQLYRAIGSLVLTRVKRVSEVTVWYDPPDALSEMEAWLGSGAYRPQCGGDLGRRLASGFDFHFGRRAPESVIAVGADAPEVDEETIAQAAEGLAHADVVLGPAVDGGYYLMGLSRPHPELFRDIPWSTPDVLAATLRVCERESISVSALPILRDVDTLEDAVALGWWPLDHA